MIHNTVTVAHISDLHLAGRHDRRSLASLDRMLRHFNERKIDHLVITGDLFDTYMPAEWPVMREKLREHDFCSWERTTLIPGNHDLITIEEEMRIYNALNPFPGSRKRALQERLSGFCALFGDLMGGDGEIKKGFPYVKVMRFPRVSLAFVGVNSVWPWHRSDNPLGARGFIDPAEFRALSQPSVAEALRGSFVIGLCHHALRVYGTSSPIDQAFDWTMELINRDEYLAVMQELRTNVIVHGHFHRFQTYAMGGVQIVNGGSFRYGPDRYSEMVIGEQGSFAQRFVTLS
ncbi:MAG: metallophosphoesterase [Chlorobium limicola]|nr:metallophosphoesterase [Chlorobium limicola]